MHDVIVIGGGPSGLMAAISAAENGAAVLLIDKGNKLGKKLAISGGGRCNVTNRLPKEEVIKHIPGNGKFLYSAFSIFDNYDIIDFFEELGVPLKEEDHGRMFPASNSAKSVVNALLNRMDELGIQIMTDEPVLAVNYGADFHTVILQNSKKHLYAMAIVIAVGGKAVPHTGSTGDGYAWAKKAGHTITDIYPTEVPLLSEEVFIKEKKLQGLALRNAAVTVFNSKNKPLITHQMDMLFTHFGVSGPAILRCSQFVVKELRKGVKQVTMEIDVFPEEKLDKIENRLVTAVEENPKKSMKNVWKGMIPERYLDFLLHINGISPDENGANISREKFLAFAHDLKHFRFTVNGSQPIEKAFVTGGGVSVKEVSPNSMESKMMPGLFFCGEILDIHGYTGGYNITSAMITGRVAGMNAAWKSMAQ